MSINLDQVQEGIPQAQVPQLAALAAHGITLDTPSSPWPGWRRAVPVRGANWQGTAYVNRGNVELRCGRQEASRLARTVPGATVKKDNDTYVRIPLTALTRFPQES
jgi:hypothetical protein